MFEALPAVKPLRRKLESKHVLTKLTSRKITEEKSHSIQSSVNLSGHGTFRKDTVDFAPFVVMISPKWRLYWV